MLFWKPTDTSTSLPPDLSSTVSASTSDFGTVADVTMFSETSDMPAPLEEPSLLREHSFVEPEADHDAIADQEASTVTYQLVQQGTKRGKARLVDSLGFTYNLQYRRSYATYWQCTVRPKKIHAELLLLNEMGVFSQEKSLTITPLRLEWTDSRKNCQ